VNNTQAQLHVECKWDIIPCRIVGFYLPRLRWFVHAMNLFIQVYNLAQISCMPGLVLLFSPL